MEGLLTSHSVEGFGEGGPNSPYRGKRRTLPIRSCQDARRHWIWEERVAEGEEGSEVLSTYDSSNLRFEFNFKLTIQVFLSLLSFRFEQRRWKR